MLERSLAAYRGYLASLRPADSRWPADAVITPEQVAAAHPHALSFALDQHGVSEGSAFPVYWASPPDEPANEEAPPIGWVVQGTTAMPLPWRPVVSRVVEGRSGRPPFEVRWDEFSRARQALAAFLDLGYSRAVEIAAGFLEATRGHGSPDGLLQRLVDVRDELALCRVLAGEIEAADLGLRIHADSVREDGPGFVTVTLRFELGPAGNGSERDASPVRWNARLDLDEMRFLDVPSDGRAKELISRERGGHNRPITHQIAAMVRAAFRA